MSPPDQPLPPGLPRSRAYLTALRLKVDQLNFDWTCASERASVSEAATHRLAAGQPDSAMLRAFGQYKAAHPAPPVTEGTDTMSKLSDTQAVLLSAAAARPDLSVLPAPDTLKVKGAALERTLAAMLRRGLIAKSAVNARGNARGRAGGDNLIITAAGLAAIGVSDPNRRSAAEETVTGASAPAPIAPDRPGGKMGTLLDAVSRPGGATIGDLTTASGWLPHTTRAALTRLRQRGFDVRLATADGRRAYCLGGLNRSSQRWHFARRGGARPALRRGFAIRESCAVCR